MSRRLAKSKVSPSAVAFNLVAEKQKSVTNASKNRVTLRLSDDEIVDLRRRASGQTLSAYIRTCLFSSATTPRKARSRSVLKSETTLARVLGLLGESKIALHLGELASYAREGSLLMDDVTYQQIEEAHATVMAMRHQLLRALGLVESQNQ